MKINTEALYVFVGVGVDSTPTLISSKTIKEATLKKQVCLQGGHVCGPIRKVPYPAVNHGCA